MNDFITANTYPAKYAGVTGHHRLVGWHKSYPEMREYILPRVFGWLVQTAAPVVREYHGDLFHDAEWLRTFLDAAMPDASHTYAQWDVCVRHSGTNLNASAPSAFAMLDYDAALYNFHLYVDERGEWWLDITLVDARPDRPAATLHDALHDVHYRD